MQKASALIAPHRRPDMLNTPIRGLLLTLFLCLGLLGSAMNPGHSICSDRGDAGSESSPSAISPLPILDRRWRASADAALVATSSAGVSLADFSASATFTNPVDTSVPWDMGLTSPCHERNISESTSIRLASGPLLWIPRKSGRLGFTSAFNAAPGAADTLDLFVEGESASFGVNGEYARP